MPKVQATNFNVPTDDTAARSYKIWLQAGERLAEQYDSGLMPPPPDHTPMGSPKKITNAQGKLRSSGEASDRHRMPYEEWQQRFDQHNQRKIK